MTTRKLGVGKWSYENKEKKKTRKKKLIISVSESVSMIQMFLTWDEGRVDIPEKTLRAQKPKTNGTAKEEIRANMVK